MDLASVTTLILQYKYAVIFVTAPFIGPSVTLLSGAFVKIDVISLIPATLTLMASELCADVFWYVLGMYHGERFIGRFGIYFGITEKRIERVRGAFHKYHDSIILISKLTAGFGIAPVIFFTAGLTKIPFRRYMAMNVIGQIIWTPLILGAGYYLGDEYSRISNVFDTMAFVATTIVIVGALLMLAHYAGNRFLNTKDL